MLSPSPISLLAQSIPACKFRSFSLKEKTPWLPYLGSLTSTSEARDGNRGMEKTMLKKKHRREQKIPAFFEGLVGWIWLGWLGWIEVVFCLVGGIWFEMSPAFRNQTVIGCINCWCTMGVYGIGINYHSHTLWQGNISLIKQFGTADGSLSMRTAII